MKHCRLSIFGFVAAFLLFAGAIAQAFDPTGHRPDKTLEWTAKFAATVVIPQVRLTDATPQEAAESYLAVTYPPEYRPKIDASAFAGSGHRVTIVAEKITILELMAMIADQIGAEVVLQPGVIVLAPVRQPR